jgi:non-specific serine/threonine protein kinase
VLIEETAATAAGGNLYVMGGFNAVGLSLSSTYVFDGSSWHSGPQLPLPLDHPSAASLDGHVYIAGGHSNGRDSARAFRLDTDHWTELAPMHFARGGHALIALDGKLYAAGGNTVRANVPQVETYDPAGNAWSVVTSLPDPRNHLMGFVLGGDVCLAGGRSPTTARVDCLDPTTGSWSSMPALPQATSGGGAATFGGREVVVLGGEDASETRIVTELTHYSQGKAWSGGESMLDPRHGFELAIYEGRAWACGGGSAPGLHPVATCTSIGDTEALTRAR